MSKKKLAQNAFTGFYPGAGTAAQAIQHSVKFNRTDGKFTASDKTPRQVLQDSLESSPHGGAYTKARAA